MITAFRKFAAKTPSIVTAPQSRTADDMQKSCPNASNYLTLPLTTEQSLAIYDLLCRFTGTSGAIRQAEFFVYREADRRILDAALERHRDGAPVEPTTWIRASAKDAALVHEVFRCQL